MTVIEARVVALYIGDSKGLEKTASAALHFTLEGISGDKHAGFTKAADARTPEYERGSLMRNDRQWSAVAVEELAETAGALGVDRIDGGWVGANLVLTGITDFTRLPKGSKLIFPSGAVLVVEAENMPCKGPGKVIASKYPDRNMTPTHYPKAAMHKRGLVGVIERAGVVHLGDGVTIQVYDGSPTC